MIGDRQRFADAGRLFNQLAPAAKLAEEWRRATSDAEGAEELLAEGEDPELRAVLPTRASRSGGSRRRSGSRWSSGTPTTPRT